MGDFFRAHKVAILVAGVLLVGVVFIGRFLGQGAGGKTPVAGNTAAADPALTQQIGGLSDQLANLFGQIQAMFAGAGPAPTGSPPPVPGPVPQPPPAPGGVPHHPPPFQPANPYGWEGIGPQGQQMVYAGLVPFVPLPGQDNPIPSPQVPHAAVSVWGAAVNPAVKAAGGTDSDSLKIR